MLFFFNGIFKSYSLFYQGGKVDNKYLLVSERISSTLRIHEFLSFRCQYWFTSPSKVTGWDSLCIKTFSSGSLFSVSCRSSYKKLKCPAKYFFCSDIWSLTLISNIELLNALGFPWYQECIFSDEILDGLTGEDWSPEKTGHKQKLGTLRLPFPNPIERSRGLEIEL